MNAFSHTAGRRRLSWHSGDEQCHHCDSQPPNHRAHRRGFFLMLAVVAVVSGLVQGLSDMGGAFSNLGALFDGGAWDKFFAGFGRFAALVLLLAATVLYVRRRRRKAKATVKK